MVKENLEINNSCAFRECCPHLDFQAAAKVLAERDYLSQRVATMARVMKLAEDKILTLATEVKQLKEEKAQLLQELNHGKLGVKSSLHFTFPFSSVIRAFNAKLIR